MMKKNIFIFTVLVCIFAASLFVNRVCAQTSKKSTSAGPADSRPKTVRMEQINESEKFYQEGLKEIKNNNFVKALELLKKAKELDRDNTDIISNLAFVRLKLGKVDEAISSYSRLILIQPDNLDARENLGRAHMKAVLKEINILKNYGRKGRKQYENLVKEFKKEAVLLKQ